MLCFTVRNCRIEVYFSFFAFTSLLLLLDDTTYIFICLAACIIHETAHLSVMICLNARIKSVSLSCRGITVSPDKSRCMPFCHELLLSASGSAVNLICAILYFVSISDIRLKLFAVMNLVVGILNLLPVTGTDGARIMNILLKGRKTKAQPYINITTAALVCAFVAKPIYSRTNNITILLFIAASLLSAAENISRRKSPRGRDCG